MVSTRFVSPFLVYPTTRWRAEDRAPLGSSAAAASGTIETNCGGFAVAARATGRVGGAADDCSARASSMVSAELANEW